jgi:HemK-related putative methylase
MSDLLRVESPCSIELECPEGVQRPGPASLALLKYLFNVRGKSVLDLGCGTGLFAIAAAKLGAREVWASDVDPAAADCARRNADRNRVEIRVKTGDLFDPVAGRTFDLIVTHPPQTPMPEEARGPETGGPDGLRYLDPLVREAPEHLEHGGQLLTLLVSLADTKRFESLLSAQFRFRGLPPEKRPFTWDEMEGVHPGLGAYLAERKARGLSEIFEEEAGPYYLARPYLAMRR